MTQLDAHGRLRHLLTLDGLGRDVIEALLDRAEGFDQPPGTAANHAHVLRGRTVANLFFEPSTRTRASFDLAAQRLGADVLNLDIDMSSRRKGESLLDTVYTLEAMRTDIFVLRDSEPGAPAYVADHLPAHVSVVNAGEGVISHPTQGLLDALTIRRHKGDFAELCVAIVGDIRHSRVAHSTARALATLGVGELRYIAPEPLLPDDAFAPGTRMTDADDGLRDADVVMALRIQRERMASADIPDADDYIRRYGVNARRMKLARPDAIVMHPGPMNRNVEITSDIADSARSVIREQVGHGVAVRMAVMATLMDTLHGAGA